MNSLTQITIPTTETVAKELPDTSRPDIPLPSDMNTVFLAGLFAIACLTVAYFAAEVIMPVLLAVVLKLVLQPGMRLLERLRIPRSLSALLLMVAMIGIIVAVGYAVSGPAKSWIDRIPEGLPRLEEKVKFISEPLKHLSKMLKMADTMGEATNAPNAAPAVSLGLSATLFAGTKYFASGLFEMVIILYFLLASGEIFLRGFVEIMPRFKDKRQVVDISLQIEDNVSAYLLTISAMNFAVGRRDHGSSCGGAASATRSCGAGRRFC